MLEVETFRFNSVILHSIFSLFLSIKIKKIIVLLVERLYQRQLVFNQLVFLFQITVKKCQIQKMHKIIKGKGPFLLLLDVTRFCQCHNANIVRKICFRGISKVTKSIASLTRMQLHQCPHTFRWAHNLKQHKILTHSNKRPFSCDLCPQTFKWA